MRILIASLYCLPGVSGGWVTPIDLLGKDHDLTYAVHRGKRGFHRLEGVAVYGPVLSVPRKLATRKILVPLAERIDCRLFEIRLRNVLARERFDCLFCLDLLTALCAQRVGCRYVLRLHDYPFLWEMYQRVRRNAVLVTSVDPSLKEALYVPHGVDLTRYTYRSFSSAESVVLVATLNRATQPMLFIDGVSASRLGGVVYGDGELRDDVIRACNRSGGKVRYEGPVSRLDLDAVYSRHQIGVACLNRPRNPYVMKVVEYMACGLAPVIQEGILQAVEAPNLCRVFSVADGAGGMAREIDYVKDHWKDFEATRREARKYAESHFDSNTIRVEFNALLARLHREGTLRIR